MKSMRRLRSASTAALTASWTSCAVYILALGEGLAGEAAAAGAGNGAVDPAWAAAGAPACAAAWAAGVDCSAGHVAGAAGELPTACAGHGFTEAGA